MKYNQNLLVKLGKRLGTYLIVIFGVTTLCFSIQLFTSFDIAEFIVRKQSVFATEEQIAATRTELGLDAPLWEQYIDYIAGIFRGDLGTSFIDGNPVLDNILAVLPVTIALVALSMTWVIVLTIIFAAGSVIFRNKAADHIIRIVCILGICVPSFWLALMLLVAFAIEIPIFNVIADGSLKSLILPSFSIAFPISCISIRVLRASVINELKQDYVLYSKARGFSNTEIIYGEVLRNALPSSITLFAQYCAALFGTSALVESVFSINGLGQYLTEACERMDIYGFSGAVLITAVLFVTFNAIAEIISTLLCPTYGKGQL